MALEYHAVAPIVQTCKNFPRSLLSLDGDTWIHKFRHEHIVEIKKEKDTFSQSLDMDGRAVVISYSADLPQKHDVENKLLALSVVLNILSTDGAVSIPKSYLIRKNRISKIENTYSHNIGVIGRHPTLSISKDSFKSISQLYKDILSVVEREKSILISIHRFNAALADKSKEEKLIDLSICLESFFSSENEIAFQFSLYNALLQDESNQKLSIYKILKKFYGQRSQIVHGARSLDEIWFDQHWPTVIKIAKVSLLKKLMFLKENPASNWGDYLLNSLLSTEQE